MGTAIAKLGLWLMVVWAITFGQSRIHNGGGTISIFDICALGSLPFVAAHLSKVCGYPLMFLIFGCVGAIPFATLLLDDWGRYSWFSDESVLAAILFRACVPVVGMGLLCRALAVHWPDFSEPIDDGHCKVCDYNLTGNVSGICPECGTAISKTVVASQESSPEG